MLTAFIKCTVLNFLFKRGSLVLKTVPLNLHILLASVIHFCFHVDTKMIFFTKLLDFTLKCFPLVTAAASHTYTVALTQP